MTNKPSLTDTDSIDGVPTDHSIESTSSDVEIKENLDSLHIAHHGGHSQHNERIEYLVISDIEDMHSGYDSNDTMDSATNRMGGINIPSVDFMEEETLSMHCSNNAATRKKKKNGGMRYMVGIGAVCAIGMWIGYGATRSIAILSSVSGSKKK